jgi:hypothetical protein
MELFTVFFQKTKGLPFNWGTLPVHSVQKRSFHKEFENLYESLHIAGYYRGLIYNVHAVKDYFSAAKYL